MPVFDLEPRQVSVTAMLSRQGAMLEELSAIIEHVRPETAHADIHRLVLEENILRRPSLSSRKEIYRKLQERYFRVTTPRANANLVRAMHNTSQVDELGLLAYTMLLWNDGLTYELGQRWLARRLQGEPFSAVTADLENELAALETDYPAIQTWKTVTRKRVARHYLSLLRDCGFARGAAQKTLRSPFIPATVILFAVQLILGGGQPAAEVPEHPLFQAMGLPVSEVVGALSAMNAEGVLRFNVQGDIVHLELQEQDVKA